MRLFFAGEIPEKYQADLGRIQEELKRFKADVKWVEPGNLHLTLCFLGDTSPKRLPDLKKIGEEIGRLYGSFHISLKGLGRFPHKGHPRVVWVGVEEGRSQISMVAQAIESRLAKLGFKAEEREFQAHITLGRLRNPNGSQELLSKLDAAEPVFEPWHFNEFILKESQPTKSGSVYKNVYVFHLGKR